MGDDHACALDAAGQAYCWGNNHGLQLGASTKVHCGIVGESGHRACYPTASDTLPLLAANGMRFASLSAGRYVTCGMDAEGRAFCWGNAMGNTAAYADQCMDGQRCSRAPVPLEPGRRFAVVDAHARCAADRDGTATCWGIRYRTEGTASAPWPERTVAALAGDGESATRCAVDRDGRAYCHGDAVFGVTGTGSRDSAVAGPVDGPARFTRLAVLEKWVCGLDAEGVARCWGTASYGDAQPGATREGFERCERWAVHTWCNTRPAAVAGAGRFRSITAMPRSTLPVIMEMVGLTAQGDAWVWGGDRVPRRWHPERQWASVSAGDWGQCGVSTRGELFCWGRNPHEVVQGLVPHPH